MACSCIKGNYDAHVTNTDCKHLIYEDQSLWMDEIGYTKPETYPLTIHIPSRGSQSTLLVYTDKRNSLTSKELFGSTDVLCLPDDIYCFTVQSCGVSYTISRAFLCNCLMRIDELVSRAESDDEIKEAKDFKSMAEAVEISVKMGKVEQAREMLTKLKKKLKQKNCTNCGCDNSSAW